MGSPSELTLDYKPNGYPGIQKPFGDHPDQTQKLEEFLARLEEERLKIEAFKRELPLCMQLLNNAMETYRQQLEGHQANQGEPGPVLEEFIPIKNMSIDGSEKAPNVPSEKVNWMASAQLWSDGAMQQAQPIKESEQSFSVSPKLALDAKQRNGGGFIPFSKEKSKGSRVIPELALASTEKEMEEKKSSEMGASSKGGGAEQGKGGCNPTEGQTHRKARRCWSPDLHRRFVNALQILGGSQVATPKQIRDLMQVDGLTNDEVKSHLQKYRLHTRRPIPAPQAATAAPPQLVVLGGIWVPQEYATSAAAAAAAGQAIYGAHPAQARYYTPPLSQEFYTAPPPPHHHHYHHPQPLHTGYKERMGSPESELRSGEERSESIEEGEEREVETEEEGGNWNGEEKPLVQVGTKAEESKVAFKF